MPDEAPASGRGHIGAEIYDQVEQMLANEKITRTEAFNRLSEQTGRRPGTVAANYYRIARQRGVKLQKRRRRGATDRRRLRGSTNRAEQSADRGPEQAAEQQDADDADHHGDDAARRAVVRRARVELLAQNGARQGLLVRTLKWGNRDYPLLLRLNRAGLRALDVGKAYRLRVQVTDRKGNRAQTIERRIFIR